MQGTKSLQAMGRLRLAQRELCNTDAPAKKKQSATKAILDFCIHH